jgi:hypothetical protein
MGSDQRTQGKSFALVLRYWKKNPLTKHSKYSSSVSNLSLDLDVSDKAYFLMDQKLLFLSTVSTTECTSHASAFHDQNFVGLFDGPYY